MQEYQNIPESLRVMNQWVCYRMEPNAKKGKPDKIPYNPLTGDRAKANNPATWADFNTAVAAYERGKYSGIGFEFGNGFFGIDLDHVVDNGQLTSEAQDILQTMRSYAEYSPSKTGVHILCKGSLPEGGRRKGNVEMYETGRFFTVTGDHLGNFYEVEERSREAAIVHEKYIGKKDELLRAEALPISYVSPSDTDLLAKAFQSKGGHVIGFLWAGDLRMHNNDHSAADQALMNHLAYWTNGDARRMDTLFRASGLMRPKWDEKRGSKTYGELTLEKALKNFVPWIEPRGSTSSTQQDFTDTYEETASSAGTLNAVETGTSANTDISKPLQHKKSASAIEFTSVSDYLDDGRFLVDIDRFGKFKNRKTGFPNLDAVCGNLYPGLYVIGAISSLGKTTFTLQLADNLAAAGEHVLYFTLEQSRLEMVSKSISRTTAQRNRETAVTAIKIRAGHVTPSVREAINHYYPASPSMHIIECNFDTTIDTIMETVKAYMSSHPGISPIVAVDYLQIIPPTDARQSDKEKIDRIMRGLKMMQAENNLVVLAVSSINRTNYLQPIDFESFKDSGNIEFGADVVWGLQLQIMNDPLFNKAEKIKEKRIAVRTAKAADPRKVELVCLKNRYGIASYACGFVYHCRYDLFEPDPGYAFSDGFPVEQARI